MPDVGTPLLLAPERFEAFVADPGRWDKIQRAEARLRERLAGRALFHVSSTARAGGLAELLLSQVAYSRGIGIDAHWEQIEASPPFLAIAKRINNGLHGLPDGLGQLGEEEGRVYEDALEPAAKDLAERIKPGDLVILHGAQTAGLGWAVKDAGAAVIWRCHVGVDAPTESAREAWSFLHPYVAQADAYVFSRSQFVWESLDGARSFTIPPVINPLSPKNQELSGPAASAILAAAGVQSDSRNAAFVRLDGTPGRVDRHVTLAGGRELPRDVPVVVQVSTWNHLKDPEGVVRGFAQFVAPRAAAHLVVAGPAVEWVPDEVEAEAVYGKTVEAVEGLPLSIRERVHVVAIPNDDAEEAAAIVNALQRRATVVLQRSRGEGFGLAVMEAMWKRRPVVCTRVGGLQEQVVDGVTGCLIDPGDAEGAGQAVLSLLGDPASAGDMGEAGHTRVARHYLLPDDAPRWIEVIECALARG